MRITQQDIDALRTTTPKATIADITTAETPYAPGFTEHIVAHLSHYAAPKKDAEGNNRPGQPCVACDATHSFTWGIAHGQGHCTRCGWPATLYHFIHDKDGNEVMAIRGLLLWAHPDDITLRD